MAADKPRSAQPGPIRYLTAADVEAMAPPPQLLREAIIRIFRAKDQDLTVHEPKMTMSIAPGHFFQSLVGASLDENRAMTKWASIVAENSGRGLPNVTSLIILTELATGQPLAILDGNWITAARTAAMTAVAATFLARADSRTIGFIGCGVQARSHLSSLTSALPGSDPCAGLWPEPGLERGLRRGGAASRAGGQGGGGPPGGGRRLRGGGHHRPVPARAAAVPRSRLGRARRLRGRRRSRPPLAAADACARISICMITDDHRQSEALGAAGKLPYAGPFDADLGDFIMGRHPGRRRRRSGRCSCSRAWCWGTSPSPR